MEKEIVKYAMEELAKLDFIDVYGPKDLSKQKTCQKEQVLFHLM